MKTAITRSRETTRERQIRVCNTSGVCRAGGRGLLSLESVCDSRLATPSWRPALPHSHSHTLLQSFNIQAETSYSVRHTVIVKRSQFLLCVGLKVGRECFIYNRYKIILRVVKQMNFCKRHLKYSLIFEKFHLVVLL